MWLYNCAHIPLTLTHAHSHPHNHTGACSAHTHTPFPQQSTCACAETPTTRAYLFWSAGSWEGRVGRGCALLPSGALSPQAVLLPGGHWQTAGVPPFLDPQAPMACTPDPRRPDQASPWSHQIVRAQHQKCVPRIQTHRGRLGGGALWPPEPANVSAVWP